MAETIHKTPREKFPFSVDFTEALPPGATLLSGTASAELNGADASSALLQTTVIGIAGAVATVQLKGGTAGARYIVKALVVCDDGSELEESIVVKVADVI